jgi:drug/metabolite transporter (DMT)-like permease
MSPSAGFVALVLAATSISLGVIAVKHGYEGGADPETVLAARLLVAAPLAALALPFLFRRHPPARAMALAGALAAGVLIWISVRGEVEGLVRLPAGALALVLATSPVFVALLDWAVAGRAPSRFDRWTMIAIVAGVAIMAAPVGSSVSLVGVLAGLASALAFATFLFLLDRNPGVPPEQAFPLGMVGAGLMVLITDPGAAAGLGDELPTWLVLALGASAAGWAVLLGIGLAATAPVTAAMVVAVEPVLVTVLAFLILGEELAARQVVGGLVVVGALAAVAARLRAEGSPAGS